MMNNKSKKQHSVMRIGRRLSALLLAALLLFTSCGGESGGNPGGSAQANKDKLSVIVTIFPLYDWTKNILGEETDAELTFLLGSGVDLHSFQPTASDVMKISSCDVFLYVGGESDAWVESALAEASNPELVALNLLELLGEDRAREEELLEGMQETEHDHGHEDHEDEDHDHEDHDHDQEDHDHDHDDHDHDDHDHEDHDHDHDDHDHEDHDHDHDDHETEYDEHIWLSLQNAMYLVPQIADTLAAKDPANAEQYRKNAEDYTAQLSALDAEYRAAVASGTRDMLLFCDRFPFRYLAEDYGLTCYAAFSGCAAETEASFETITFLAEKVKEFSLPHVLTIEGSDAKIADTVLESAGAKESTILSLDSMQSTTTQDAANGTYLSVMEQNLEILKKVLQ